MHPIFIHCRNSMKEEIDLVEDRRAFKRYKLREPVRYQFDEPSRLGGSISRDISQGGIQIRLTEFIPLKTMVTLEIQLPGGRVAECKGEVVWIYQVPFM